MASKYDLVLKDALRRDAIWQRARARAGRGVKTLSSNGCEPSTERRYYCREIAENYVAGDKIRAAIVMLNLCQRKLKIQTLLLTWYCYCSSLDPGAKSIGPRPTKAFVELAAVPKIWLRSDLSVMDLQLAAAHEAHHCWMEAQPAGKFANLDAGDRENCADAFAYLMLDELRRMNQGPPDANPNW